MSPLSAPARHPVLACADQVEAAVKGAIGTNPTFMTTDAKAEALVRLSGLVDQLETLRLRVIAVAGDVADHDGAPTVAAWLAPRTRGDHRPAHRAEQLAVALEERWTLLGEATAGGRVTVAQAEVITRALDNLDDDVEPDLLRRAEAHLVDQASLFTPRQLRVLGERVLEVICPDTYDDHERAALLAAERRANAATRLTLSTRGDGSVDLRARLPEATASRLRTYLEAFTAPRHQEPGKRVPHERRMGQAFCALLDRIDPATLPEHAGAATRVVVTIEFGHLLHGLGTATLADGTRITADHARRLACTAGLLPAVLSGDSEVLDLGRTKRLFTPAQRQALTLRHRECRADGCTVPSTWCEAHHRDPWATGGPTDLDHAELLCPHHHRRIHDPDYTHRRHPDGTVRFHRRT
jgi:hypothetical protein